ncbi:zonadhesin-like [Procambarus clarkii]|uniref:zonadhesin-like n=1 Tax=Procambarus clarkii TaxID=6728 RepID=UPI003742FE35
MNDEEDDGTLAPFALWCKPYLVERKKRSVFKTLNICNVILKFTLTNKAITLTYKELTLTNKEFTRIYKEFTLTNKEFTLTYIEFTLTNIEFTLTNKEFTFTNKDLTLTNKELTLTNKELTLTNNKFTLTNKELTLTNKELTLTDKELALTNKKFTLTNKEFTLTNKEFTLTNKDFTLANRRYSTYQEASPASGRNYTCSQERMDTWKIETTKEKTNLQCTEQVREDAHRVSLEVGTAEEKLVRGNAEVEEKVPGHDPAACLKSMLKTTPHLARLSRARKGSSGPTSSF